MMFGQQPYVYQQPIYNQPPMMQEPMMRPQYQPAPQYPTPQPQPQQPSGGQSIIWVPNEKAANEFIVAPNNAVTLDRKSTRLNSSHKHRSRMPSSA